MITRLVRSLWFAPLLVACVSEAPSIRTLEPALAVAPEVVEFGEVGPPLSATLPLFINNAGRATLEATLTLPDSVSAFAIDTPALELGVGDEAEVLVTFTPHTFRDYSAQLRIDSDDPDKPTVWIPLRGTGADLDVPDITIDYIEIEADDVSPGSLHYMKFDVINDGAAPLELQSVRLEGDPEFQLSNDNLDGYTISPGARKLVTVEYSPVDDLGDKTDVLIKSNDPDEPEIMFQLVGNDGIDPPVAVIDCPSQVLLTGPETVTLDGSQSYDPQLFYPIRYQWRITQRPAASDTDFDLDPDYLSSVDLYVDVGGTWEVELVVKNGIYLQSDPTYCRFEAIPEDELHLELSWDTSAADMDLHLIQGGQEYFDEPYDCNYCNKNPNWGASGPVDDPRLDIDDQGGFGPENINIEEPEDGTYDVKVHYFRQNGDGPVTATVRVWLLGVEVDVLQRVMLYNEVWDVGVIDMPSGLFIPDTALNYESPRRSCF